MSIQFLNPHILWFLFLLIIPIIIHLFNFKRFTKVYFSNLRFLKNFNTENKRKSKLKKLLILLLRLLALACIIIAFAQPSLNSKLNNSHKQERLSIYIDNSFSMNGNTEEGNALEIAKNKAFELIKSVPDDAKIKVYSNDISHLSVSLNKDQAIARIQDIQPSPVNVKLSNKIKNITIDTKDESNDVFVFSDFQKYQSDFENITTDSLMSIHFVPFKIQIANNISLDSCWFDKPYRKSKEIQQLHVKLTNTSVTDLEKLPVQLKINDSIRAIVSADLKAYSTQIIQLKFTNPKTGYCLAKIELNDHPIIYDNNLFFSYKIDNNSNILSINEFSENKYVSKLFQLSSDFELTNIEKSKLYNQNLNNYKLVILNEIKEIESGLNQNIKNYLKNGGNVLFVPGERISSSVNSFLSEISASEYTTIDSSSQRLSLIEKNAEIYKDVFKELDFNTRLPDIFKHYILNTSNSTTTETIWKTAGGDNLFVKQNFGLGQFFQLSMNLKPIWTNLIVHPIFVPSVINLTKSKGTKSNLYDQTGKNISLTVNASKIMQNDIQYHITNLNSVIDFIPQQFYSSNQSVNLYTHDQIRNSGHFFISHNDSIIETHSFNYSRKESIPEYYSEEDVKSKITSIKSMSIVISPSKMKLSEFYNEQRDESSLWITFILLCFTFMLAESIIQNINNKP